jgi:rare lipoprotein A
MIGRPVIWLVSALVVLTSACSTLPRIPTPGNRGIASWYGEPFHGRLTANGERYDMHALTAAHRLYAFGTRLRVTNLDTRRSVVVRVNDRGPFVRGRIIDLSYAAATAIGMVAGGTASVRLDPLPEAVVADGESIYTVQIGAFQDATAARALEQQLRDGHADVFVIMAELDGATYYRVRVGRLGTVSAAERLARRLAREGFSPFVTRQDPGPMLR